MIMTLQDLIGEVSRLRDHLWHPGREIVEHRSLEIALSSDVMFGLNMRLVQSFHELLFTKQLRHNTVGDYILELKEKSSETYSNSPPKKQ